MAKRKDSSTTQQGRAVDHSTEQSNLPKVGQPVTETSNDIVAAPEPRPISEITAGSMPALLGDIPHKLGRVVIDSADGSGRYGEVKLHRSEYQTRSRKREFDTATLVRSMGVHGYDPSQPILISESGEIFRGHRRINAVKACRSSMPADIFAKYFGEGIPAIVYPGNLTADQRLELVADHSEEFAQMPYTRWERIEECQLMLKQGWTQQRIATALGLSGGQLDKDSGKMTAVAKGRKVESPNRSAQAYVAACQMPSYVLAEIEKLCLDETDRQIDEKTKEFKPRTNLRWNEITKTLYPALKIDENQNGIDDGTGPALAEAFREATKAPEDKSAKPMSAATAREVAKQANAGGAPLAARLLRAVTAQPIDLRDGKGAVLETKETVLAEISKAQESVDLLKAMRKIMGAKEFDTLRKQAVEMLTEQRKKAAGKATDTAVEAVED